MRKIFTLLCALAMIMNVYAQDSETPDVIWEAPQQGYYSNQVVLGALDLGSDLSGTLTQVTTPPVYLSTELVLCMTGECELSLSAKRPIAKVVIVMNGNENQTCLQSNVGSYSLEDKFFGIWTGEHNAVTFTVPYGKEARIQIIQVFFYHYDKTFVTLPEGLQTKRYLFESLAGDEKMIEGWYINAGRDEEHIYIQGLSQLLPDGWVRGTYDNAESKMYFENWLIGTYRHPAGNYDLIFSGAKMYSDLDFLTLDCGKFLFMTADGDTMETYEMIDIRFVEEMEGTPNDPVIYSVKTGVRPYIRFSLRLSDTEGRPMAKERLTYQILIMKGNEVTPLELSPNLYPGLQEDWIEIPFEYADGININRHMLYFNQEEEQINSWDKVGLQTIYRGADKEHKSNIVWYDMRAEQGMESIQPSGVRSQKVIKDGQLLIEKNGKTYNATGAEVR